MFLPTDSKRASAVLLWLILPFFLTACSRPPEPLALGGQTMGTYWTVLLHSPPEPLDVAELEGQITQLLDKLNDEVSTYRSDSLISQFNRAPAGTVIALPAGFASVLKEALFWAQATDGAFDPTAGPLTNLWGFGPERGKQTPPAADLIDAALKRVGWERLPFQESTGSLRQPGDVYLDLSAIAKGWGVDRVADHLGEAGMENFLVDIGGEIRVAGSRPDNTGWRVGIERPAADQREAITMLEMKDLAIATSGSYRNFFEAGEQSYSHLIDPRTGQPVTHSTVSVTVAADSATAADALATALSIMPIEEAVQFASGRDIAVFWLLVDGEVLRERMTPAFERLINQ
ncbi:MAG TPA: FAD:protein FMN transferase [Wenzhouxiangella sp.]|nr:FAD:protein FMN transferase [Wenzhouxiangella sp.]